MKPVRTRVPLRGLALIAAAASISPLLTLVSRPLRPDLAALPRWWVFGAGAIWMAGFVVPLCLAVLPRRGQVLPDSARAGAAAALAGAALVLMGLLFTVDAQGITRLPATAWDGFFPRWWHCLSFGLSVTLPTLAVGALLLHRVVVARPAAVGAAVGAAGGAFAGLTLHGICSFGGGVHVGLAHGGGVLVGALVGGLSWMLLARGASRLWRGAGARAPRTVHK
jgi:hypothetical protein